MTCRERTIQDLLPSYVEGSLGEDDRNRVELHIGRCDDCTEEIGILRLLAGEPVPDPGGAFWSSLADRVHRQTQGRQDVPRPHGLLTALFRSSWVRGTFATAAVLIVSWMLFRPAGKDAGETTVIAERLHVEDLYDTTENMADLEIAENAGLASWMARESLPLQNAVERLSAAGNLDRPLDEYLSGLDRKELTDVATALSRQEEAGT